MYHLKTPATQINNVTVFKEIKRRTTFLRQGRLPRRSLDYDRHVFLVKPYLLPHIKTKYMVAVAVAQHQHCRLPCKELCIPFHPCIRNSEIKQYCLFLACHKITISRGHTRRQRKRVVSRYVLRRTNNVNAFHHLSVKQALHCR